MKIAFIGQKGIPAVSGGIEKHVENLAINLADYGHEVYVYTRHNYTDKKLLNYKGVNLISLPSIPTKHLDAISHTFLACIDAIFRRDYDVIHFQSIGPSSLIWLVKFFRPKTPIVGTFHSQCYYHKKWNFAARTYLKFGEYVLCKCSDKVVTVSRFLKEYCEKKYNISTVYLPNGVNQVVYHEPQIIKEKWGLEKDSYISYIGRLIAHKGVHYLIEAYKNIKTDKKLVIVGSSFFTDEYVTKLKKMAEDNPNIIFTGELSGETLAEMHSNAYLFVQPSESEGLSIALLEAMSFGTAVLVSDIPENKEAVGKVGFLFENKNVEDLRIKLEYYLKNISIVEENRSKGIERIKKHYDWIDIARGTIELYRYLYAKKHGEKDKLPFFRRIVY